MNRQTQTKQSILDAALYLFHLKGYHATTIRDIAGKAQVNTANIAYYFKNKQGLLEYCYISYFEEYISILDKNAADLKKKGPVECLLDMVLDILSFQRKNFLASSFIYGEFSLDSSLNREILSTYLMKEKYFFQLILENGIEQKDFMEISVPLYILQLKGLLTAPLVHSQYAREVLHIFPQETYYTEKYAEEVCHFLQATLLYPVNPIKQQDSQQLLLL
ncbi:forespore capture DNA-binding protein RefZ [Bacillus sp. CECT 9360]|uniref:forespore capture DNA-binding protein RefZ n=1 Tax=Bacillus sp. CECT 9360 TaxID=2845821 RepID=UPI001E3E2053|nr:forespore capture DNA-binding protein RefZ [Bacillus sp. CECT 9360]CAH0346855.1 putative HTH-type transcriptional regulator YttP [Bacillus sp. CECT 9360]